MSASATAIHRGSLCGSTSTREVIKRGGSYAGACRKVQSSVCVCLQGEGQESEGGGDKRREGRRPSVIPDALL